MTTGVDIENIRALRAALAQIDARLRVAVTHFHAQGRDPANTLRGFLINQDEIDAYLAGEPLADAWPLDWLSSAHPSPATHPADAPPAAPPLTHLQARFGLSSLDIAILLLALAPELDQRYEHIFGYLQDNIAQRRPTVNLAMRLLAHDVATRFAVWARLAAHNPLRKQRLVVATPDPEQRHPTFLAYQLKVDHRIVAHLLGEPTPDARLAGAVTPLPPPEAPPIGAEELTIIAAQLPQHPLVLLYGAQSSAKRLTAAAWCQRHDYPLLRIDLRQLQRLDIAYATAWLLALREGYLADAAILLDGWESCLDADGLPPARLWAAILDFPKPVFLCADQRWHPRDEVRQRRLLVAEMAIPGYAYRLRHWEAQTVAAAITLPQADLQELAGKFALTPEQIARAVQSALDTARSNGRQVTLDDLQMGVQTHASARLDKLARQIQPRHQWADLVLPPDRLEQLRELCQRVRHEHLVRETWGFGRKVAPRRGVSALFAGESGTGKTMAAEVIAHTLGLALYQIDLSAVVSKYIGETEKNLSAIFKEATASNAMLFFDEADALFGKRAEVKDAHDRYANIEVAHLLQQIEAYDGLAILATNLRQNLDEAFTRRLDFMVDFPRPDPPYRERIWTMHFPPEAPLAPDIDCKLLASRYPLTGGNIRNVVLASAYLAAADGGTITMTHVRQAIRREHQKIGRLLESDAE